MRLYHYSAEPFVLDPHRAYRQDQPFQLKPNGLWLSVDDPDTPSIDWREWCEREEFRLHALTQCAEVVLVPDANILQLDTEPALVAFTRRYQTNAGGLSMIDWGGVAREFQGLLIAPYQWRRRLDVDMVWYYAWDCASACIWDCMTLRQVPVEEVTE